MQLNNTSIQFFKLMAVNMIALRLKFFMANTGIFNETCEF